MPERDAPEDEAEDALEIVCVGITDVKFLSAKFDNALDLAQGRIGTDSALELRVAVLDDALVDVHRQHIALHLGDGRAAFQVRLGKEGLDPDAYQLLAVRGELEG